MTGNELMHQFIDTTVSVDCIFTQIRRLPSNLRLTTCKYVHLIVYMGSLLVMWQRFAPFDLP